MKKQVVIVLWAGGVGGAETLMGDVAISMRQRAIDVSVLCIGDTMPLADRLQAAAVPCTSMGYQRGSTVVLHPRRLANTMQELGGDGAIVNAAGYLPWLIRQGGYRFPMLVVEHGDALNMHTAPYRRRLRVRAERWLCARTNYVDIAVSDTLLRASVQITGRYGARRIYNGVNLQRFSSAARMGQRDSDAVVVGAASRLARGKGIEILLSACARIRSDSAWILRIAGDGPEAPKLRAQVAADRVLSEHVTFLGSVADMPGFWAGCDIAVVASSQWIESFSMAAVEAMACGVPLVASASGALPEICGECGTLVASGDVGALASALQCYIDDPEMRIAHGVAGRERAERLFDIEQMVDQYLQALDQTNSDECEAHGKRFRPSLRDLERRTE